MFCWVHSSSFISLFAISWPLMNKFYRVVMALLLAVATAVLNAVTGPGRFLLLTRDCRFALLINLIAFSRSCLHSHPLCPIYVTPKEHKKRENSRDWDGLDPKTLNSPEFDLIRTHAAVAQEWVDSHFKAVALRQNENMHVIVDWMLILRFNSLIFYASKTNQYKRKHGWATLLQIFGTCRCVVCE